MSSPFQKAVTLMLAGWSAVLLAFASLFLPGAPVVAVVLFALGLLVALLPLGVTCPRCGHSIILPAESLLSLAERPRLVFVSYLPSRQCRKCGHRLDRPAS